MANTEMDRSTDHDSPWKIALDGYFKEFLELLFPTIPAEIDWDKGYTSLDKELQQVTADSISGRRYADKLVKVFTRDGDETWVLIHVEVQGEAEDAFDHRMYTYQYRLKDRLRLMYERGYSKQQIQELFNVIDWMIKIPNDLNEDFLNAIYAIEEDKKMPYINTAERVGLEKGELIGIEKGRQEGEVIALKKLIKMKFGALPDWAEAQITTADTNQLDLWIEGILSAETLEGLLGKH